MAKKKPGAWSDDCWFAKYPDKVKPTLVGWTASDGVKISWQKMTGAKSYTVYFSKSPNTGWKKVGTTKKTSFIVKRFNGSALTTYVDYYYKVVATKKVKKKSINSDNRFYGRFRIETKYSW